MAKFLIGDLVRVRNHHVLEESDVCEVRFYLGNNEYNVGSEDTLAQHTVADCDMDLVLSVEDVNACANMLPPKFVVGERICYHNKKYFVHDNDVERTDEGIMICIDDTNNLYVPETECASAPMPDISWEDVEDIIAAKFAELFQAAKQQDITGNCTFVIRGGGYLASNEPTFTVSVAVGYTTVEGSSLPSVFDVTCRRYHENEAMKPKLLPKN